VVAVEVDTVVEAALDEADHLEYSPMRILRNVEGPEI
jgi:hypothetical protein